MPYWKCYYHLVWATKLRQLTITPNREQLIIATIRRVSAEINCEIIAINGTEDHIHVATAIIPSVSVAEWVKKCKGASSYMVNQQFPTMERFSWQTGYGVLTFGQKVLPFVVAYIANQKQHHANGETQSYLEQMSE